MSVEISVIMGIYNCEMTIAEAIDSILAQTYSDWELIMCDDGSIDNTYKIAKEYSDKYPNIHLYKNESNLGLNKTLNKCLKYAKGKFIARMDGDDICSPIRFEKEIEVLNNEPNISIVSSDMEFFDESGVWGKISHPEYPQKKDFIKGSPFCHAPCMVRKEAYDAVNGYSEEDILLRIEDYHLWYKMYKAGFKGKNINSVLYSMRDDQNAYNRRKFKYRLNEAYVRFLIVKDFDLSFFNYIYVLRPIIVGVLPRSIYDILHKMNLKGKDIR